MPPASAPISTMVRLSAASSSGCRMVSQTTERLLCMGVDRWSQNAEPLTTALLYSSAMMTSASTDVFSRVYREGLWVRGSGEGSLPMNTVEYRAFLQEFLREEKIETVLDIGCGDWQSSCLLDWSGIDYVGIDTVPSVIADNRRRYDAPNITFLLADAALEETELPSVDLLLLKDVLQHWPDSMILSALPRFLRSARRILFTDDLREGGVHTECALGAHRPLDLREAPFGLPLVHVLRTTVHETSQGKVTQKSTFLYRRPSDVS